jgi:hypothetical protein
MCIKKINLLWGTSHERTLFCLVGLLEFINSISFWLFSTIWTVHMVSNDFSPSAIAVCYSISHLSRAINSAALRYFNQLLPVIFFSVHILCLIPCIIYPNEVWSNAVLGLFKFGDMQQSYFIMLGLIVNNRKSMGMIDIIDMRYKQCSVMVTCAWVLGYISSAIIGGIIYEKYNFQTILVIQIIGVIIQLIMYILIYYCGYRYASNELGPGSVPALGPVPVPALGHKWSLLDTTWLFFIPFSMFTWSSLLSQYVPIILMNGFSVPPSSLSVIVVIGDLLGSLIIINQMLDNEYFKFKACCFREPIKIICLIFSLGAFTLLFIVPNLTLVIIGNIFTGIIYVVVNQVCSNYILIFSKNDKMFKRNSSYFSISAKLSGLLSSCVCPFLFEIDSNLPFQVISTVAFVNSIIIFFVFERHIRLYYNESIFSLPKSIFKLELEKQNAAGCQEINDN